MTYQPGRIERAKLSDRLLFAMRPPHAAQRAMTRLLPACNWRGSVVAEDRLHVTLSILDDYQGLPPGLVEAVRRAGESVDLPAFDVCFDRIYSRGTNAALRPSRRPAGLSALSETLGKAMARQGVATRRGWRFNPHVTLGYGDGRRFTGTVAPVVWRVDRFVLIHSHVGLTRHDVLGEWTLREEPTLL